MPPTPLSLSEVPTLSLLYKTSRLTHKVPASGSLPSPSSSFNDLISLIRTDITSLRVSAIVNAANRSLLGGGGVDGVIHARAGSKLLDECKRLDGCETGSAKITGAYKLPCDKVIHAVGPIYWAEKEKRAGREKELLRGCYRKSLELAKENRCKSIAFSCLSTGVYGYPSNEAAHEALDEVRQWVLENEPNFGGLERIVFCCFEAKDERAYEELIPTFFPPVPASSGAEAQEPTDKVKSMPSPPTVPPTSLTLPPSKKQKLSEDSDWEAVYATSESATNGVEDNIEVETGRLRSTSIHEDVMTQEKKEEQNAALHLAQMGGDPPQSMLEKDW